MVNPEVIKRRLTKIEEYLTFLERTRRYSEAEFVNDAERYGSAERFLQLAIEATLDLGNHLIAELNLGNVAQSRDIPHLLSRAGHVAPELAQRWIRMIGFRYILVHDYTEIDRRIVFGIIQSQLDDIRALAVCFARLL